MSPGATELIRLTDERSLKLFEDLRADAPEARAVVPQMTDFHVLEPGTVQKLAGLQILVELFNDQLRARRPKRRR